MYLKCTSSLCFLLCTFLMGQDFYIVITRNVDFCKNELRFLPFTIFHLNLILLIMMMKMTTIQFFILFVKYKSRGSMYFKVVWDTLQYFQGWQNSKKMIKTSFKNSKSRTFALKNAWFKRATRLLAYPSTNWAMRKVTK